MTVSPMTEARRAVITALAPLGVTVYGAPPETVTPPAVLLMPAEGEWAKQITFGKTQVNVTATLLASFTGTNEAALERLESLAWDARKALDLIGIVGSVVSPRLVKIGAAEVAAADLSLAIHVTNEE